MDSTELQSDSLEAKGRDELITIATALGGKPASRARKAEIVELILDLASGGTPSTANTEESEKETTASDQETTTKDEEEPLADWEVALKDETEEESKDDDSSKSVKPETSDNASSGRTSSSKDSESRSSSNNREKRSNEYTEPGNRRRRRRGRGPESQDDSWDGDPVSIEGYLDLRNEGYGFLRTTGFRPSKQDAYVSVKQVKQFDLRRGDYLVGGARPANRSEKNPALLRLDTVNGNSPEDALKRPHFEDLTPLFPDERLNLELAADPANMTARIVDLLSPIGKGQRGLIVSPPKAGKTTIMKQIARSIETNNPEVKLIVLLVDERPEEVTDMKRWLINGEVAASTFDRPAEEHTAIAEVTIELSLIHI